ncbi:MAG: fumarylacetoacetate hydrolase family protein [Endomicrobiia bacterium]
MNLRIYAKIAINGKQFFGIVDKQKKLFYVISSSYFESNWKLTDTVIKLEKNKTIKFLPPCCPTKIVCVGLNFTDHAKELNMPLPKYPIIFLKPPSAIIGHKDKIIYPKTTKQLHYEAELAVIIKRKAKNIKPSQVKDYILGFSCFNDVTARDIQKKDGQWTRAKSFDTFAPVGPWIVSKELDITNLKIQSILNGKIMQNSSTKNLIFKMEYVVSFISKIMTLYPQDIITLGTPAGVGEMKRGDCITIRIENIGELTNYVE